MSQQRRVASGGSASSEGDSTTTNLRTQPERTLDSFFARKASETNADSKKGAETTPGRARQCMEWGMATPSCQWGRYLKQHTSHKIAAFDLDGTLIRTKSGRVYPKGAHDWVFLYPLSAMRDRLHRLKRDGYRIVLFSNQSKMDLDEKRLSNYRTKLTNLAAQLSDIPFMIFFATSSHDFYRKPAPGMWKVFVERYNGSLEVSLDQCFFVGDAAGREEGWREGKRKDHSDCDRKFAWNSGLRFQTPEEFWQDEEPVPFSLRGFDPRSLEGSDIESQYPPFLSPISAQEGGSESRVNGNEVSKSTVGTVRVLEMHNSTSTKRPDVVVLVGYPASGKSSFARKHFKHHNYVIVNQDSLGTFEKCQKAARLALESGKSVVIDNTNPSAAVRRHYIQMADAFQAQVRCFWFQASQAMALHLNQYRSITQSDRARHLPKMAFNTYKQRFEEPSTIEGFAEVKKVGFRPDDTLDKSVFYYWLT